MPDVIKKCKYEDDNINTANASVNKMKFELEKYKRFSEFIISDVTFLKLSFVFICNNKVKF